MRFQLILLGAVALAMSGCGKSEPPAPPVHIEPSQVQRMVHQASDLDGRRIELDGYIGFDNGANGQAIAIGQVLTTDRDGRGEELIRFDLKQGAEANQLNLPVISRDRFVPNAPEVVTFDLRKASFQDSAGKAHPLSDKVRVTGRLVYLGLGNTGPLSDPDPSSPSGRRFKPRLTDVVLVSPTPN